jgi:hypothetical protein
VVGGAVVAAGVVVGADVLVASAAGSVWTSASVPSAVELVPQPAAKNTNTAAAIVNTRKDVERLIK